MAYGSDGSAEEACVAGVAAVSFVELELLLELVWLDELLAAELEVPQAVCANRHMKAARRAQRNRAGLSERLTAVMTSPLLGYTQENMVVQKEGGES